MPEYGRLLEEIKNQGEIGDLPLLNAAKPYLIAALYQDLKVPLVVITAKADNASRLKDQIVAWRGSDSNIDLFPEPDTLPYQRVTSDNFSETKDPPAFGFVE
jgi:transcription-repair coupling factor (superfamily II helicase)